MNLSRDQQEKITLGIQAALGVIVIALSVRSSARVQTSAAKKLAKKDARQLARLHKNEYKLKTRLMEQKYRAKMRSAK